MTIRPLLLALALLAPTVAALPNVPAMLQDDAGSGTDAPDDPDPTFLIQPLVVYEARTYWPIADRGDWYAFEAEAGQALSVRTAGNVGCYHVFDPDGAQQAAYGCAYALGGDLSDAELEISLSGVWYLHFTGFTPGPYWFSFGLDAPAPAVSPLPDMPPVGGHLPPQDDAGSGRDAPDQPDPAFLIQPFVDYDASTAPPADDADDWYAFEAAAGQELTVSVALGRPCVSVFDPDGAFRKASGCDPGTIGLEGVRMEVARSGVWYLRFSSLTPGPYRFSFGLDAPGPTGIPLPVVRDLLPQDDAGSGRDAPDERDPAFLVEPFVIHDAFLDWPFADVGDWYAFEAEAGQVLTVRATGNTGCHAIHDPDGTRQEASGCAYVASDLGGSQMTLPRSGVWYVHFTTLNPGPYRFSIGLDAPAPDPSPVGVALPSTPLVPGDDPTCGTGAPVTATAGDGGAAVPSLVFAALKTGFRAVVAWETDAPTLATLRYNASGGKTLEVAEPTPRTQHLFVLDGLPVGASLCFDAADEAGALLVPAQALRLANAMNAYDAASGAYSLNLLVLANEQPDVAAVQAGMDGFARRLWDATDGHVRAGRIVVAYGDLDHHNTGWTSCYIAFAFVDHAGLSTPSCRHLVDVMFSHDAPPGGAAATYRDGIRSTHAAIWMHAYFQAPLTGLFGDDEAAVLTHEMGHYAFGMMDLYGSLAGTDPDCWEPAKGLSVMGGNRAATELDDEVNRCPNEAGIQGYVPSWTLLRERFPMVPDRAGVIDAGPSGDGGAYARHDFFFLPQASMPAPAVDVQDDAGSGRDAGDSPDGAVLIQPGVTYDAVGGALGVDSEDFFAFDATAGQVAEVRVSGATGCYTLLDPSLVELGSECSTSHASISGPLVATLPETGRYHLAFGHVAPGLYRFAVGLDAPAPAVSPVEGVPSVEDLLPPQDDAGSGRDAPDSPTPNAPLVAPGVVYEGTLHGAGVDDGDTYAFDATAGQVAELLAAGSNGCYAILQEDGTALGRACVRGEHLQEGPVRVTIPETGRYYASIPGVAPAEYRFGIGLDAPAPGLG